VPEEQGTAARAKTRAVFVSGACFDTKAGRALPCRAEVKRKRTRRFPAQTYICVGKFRFGFFLGSVRLFFLAL
jgi:hypothetical protein